MRFTTETRNTLLRLAAESPDQEVCGLIDSAGKVYPIRNVAARGAYEFTFHKADYYQALNSISRDGLGVAAIYHSHPGNDTTPSGEDLATARKFALPMVIVSGPEMRCFNE